MRTVILRGGPPLGIRGRTLLLFSLGWLLLAAGTSVGAVALHPLHELLPLPLRVVVWAVPGLVGLVGTWYVPARALGFALVVVPPVFMCALRVIALPLGYAIEPIPARALYGAAMWALLAGVILSAIRPDPCVPPARTKLVEK